jgi:hypothetical protein
VNGDVSTTCFWQAYSDFHDPNPNNSIARLASLASRGGTGHRAVGLSQEVVAHVAGKIKQ